MGQVVLVSPLCDVTGLAGQSAFTKWRDRSELCWRRDVYGENTRIFRTGDCPALVRTQISGRRMGKYNCTYCQNTIVTCRIHCVECTEFDLCLQASHVTGFRLPSGRSFCVLVAFRWVYSTKWLYLCLPLKGSRSGMLRTTGRHSARLLISFYVSFYCSVSLAESKRAHIARSTTTEYW